MALTKTNHFDQIKSDLFANDLINTLNQGALCILISIGHRMRLFDQMHGKAPMSCDVLSKQTGLRADYLRQWLDAMVDCGILELDPSKRSYSLPDEHADFLTQGSMQANFANLAQSISLMGQFEDNIIDALENGDGMVYDKYPAQFPLIETEFSHYLSQSILQQALQLVPGAQQSVKSRVSMNIVSL